MKRTYPIRESKAIEQFRSHLSNDPGTIQMVLSLAEIAQLLRQGVSQLLHEAEKRLLLIRLSRFSPSSGWLAETTSERRPTSWSAPSGKANLHELAFFEVP